METFLKFVLFTFGFHILLFLFRKNIITFCFCKEELLQEFIEESLLRDGSDEDTKYEFENAHDSSDFTNQVHERVNLSLVKHDLI